MLSYGEDQHITCHILLYHNLSYHLYIRVMAGYQKGSEGIN
jgi:hypothetical protein